MYPQGGEIATVVMLPLQGLHAPLRQGDHYPPTPGVNRVLPRWGDPELDCVGLSGAGPCFLPLQKEPEFWLPLHWQKRTMGYNT